MDQKKKIYVGSGKKARDYDIVNISVCLDQIPPEHINEFNGKKYVSLTVAAKREADQYGKTHSVSINEFKPDASKQKQKSMPPPQAGFDDDLPF